MLEIKPCLTSAEVAAYCKKCGKLPGPAFYLYRAQDRGQTLAAALFEVESDRVSPVYYECAPGEGAALFDAVLRAGFHYAAGQGIPAGALPEVFRAAHRGYFACLNYPAQSRFGIENFFAKYKACHTPEPQ